ncbi:MAG: hypothetical protein M1828_003924 [Chrysothrix sp. TS-e1954]|nr:MAG: hypothetical protein M1828_003924 [Chrysothrix sp. TS-e1954]
MFELKMYTALILLSWLAVSVAGDASPASTPDVDRPIQSYFNGATVSAQPKASATDVVLDHSVTLAPGDRLTTTVIAGTGSTSKEALKPSTVVYANSNDYLVQVQPGTTTISVPIGDIVRAKVAPTTPSSLQPLEAVLPALENELLYQATITGGQTDVIIAGSKTLTPGGEATFTAAGTVKGPVTFSYDSKSEEIVEAYSGKTGGFPITDIAGAAVKPTSTATVVSVTMTGSAASGTATSGAVKSRKGSAWCQLFAAVVALAYAAKSC